MLDNQDRRFHTSLPCSDVALNNGERVGQQVVQILGVLLLEQTQVGVHEHEQVFFGQVKLEGLASLIVESDDSQHLERLVGLQEIHGQVLTANVSRNAVGQAEVFDRQRHVGEGGNRPAEVQTNVDRRDFVEQSEIV